MDSQALRTLQKKRTTNFREDETKLLIQLWGSPQIQNKLYLTHRKAPVMRLLAANMQHRGFYRTPDEIKTRIRNLKCLYHRIKRSMQTGTGIGTVDPDWPHFKAMDEILSKKNQNKTQNLYKDNIFEGPRCEDIKQEVIDEIDINDDMESFTTNSMNGSDTEFDEEAHRMPSLTPSLHVIDTKEKDEQEPVKIAPKPPALPQPKVLHNNLQIPLQGVRHANGSTPTIPFPLLILNGLPNAAAVSSVQNGQNPLKKDALGGGGGLGLNQQDVSGILKSLLDVQKENLEIEKQRLELEKQKLEFERLVGTQLLTLLPMFGGLLQRLAFPNHAEGHSSDTDTPSKKNGKKRPCPDSGFDILKDSKILRNVLEQGIKKYMLGESGNDSGKEDRGVNEDSNSSSK
ncbi:uncharacterized protein LOC108906076 [Anoplophora glabripennis]|uniref:uncharacterized protein LOC108906076 n=1 Tax=Anoplophora glabripennis TaxID=217634 RepID=UPI0008738F8F|nr:uncharacterized protein LOC108906076 [Anoplophora glabripennis]